MSILSTIVVILGISASVTKLCDVLVGQATKNEIKAKIEEYWIRLDDREPSIILQAPLRLLSGILNSLLGNRCFSKKAFSRTVLLSTALLITSLSITGLFTRTPFAMNKFPWDYFDQNIRTEKLLYEKGPKDADEIETKIHENRWSRISRFDTKQWKLFYSAAFIMLIFIGNGTLDSMSFSISRLMLNEMVETKSYLLLLSVLFLNIVLSFFIATLTLFMALFVSYPLAFLDSIRLVIIIFSSSLSLTSIITFAAGIGIWNWGSPPFLSLCLKSGFELHYMV
jgi:hypothetical protein